MKRQDISVIIASAIFAAIVALIASNSLLNSQQKQLSVPKVEKITSDFPDVKNNPQYNAIFNPKALDPTQTIVIGNGQNGAPFNGQ